MRIVRRQSAPELRGSSASIGAFLTSGAMREVMVVEAPDGFVVQGMIVDTAATGQWSEHLGAQTKETFTFLDDDIARFMEEGHARRDNELRAVTWGQAGYYEQAFRVVGRYVDEQKPQDIFFFEQDGAFVLRFSCGRRPASPALSSPNSRGDEVEAIESPRPRTSEARRPSHNRDPEIGSADAGQGG